MWFCTLRLKKHGVSSRSCSSLFLFEMENLWRQRRQTFDQEIANICLQLQEPEIQNNPHSVAELQRQLETAVKNWKIVDLELEILLYKTEYENATTAEEKKRLSDLIKVTRDILLRKSLESTSTGQSFLPSPCVHLK